MTKLKFRIDHCPYCRTEQPITVIEKEETYNVLGIDKITITASVCTCDICKHEIWNDDIDNLNLIKAYRIFAERHPEINFPAKRFIN